MRKPAHTHLHGLVLHKELLVGVCTASLQPYLHTDAGLAARDPLGARLLAGCPFRAMHDEFSWRPSIVCSFRKGIDFGAACRPSHSSMGIGHRRAPGCLWQISSAA